jgi:hypothetical protein
LLTIWQRRALIDPEHIGGVSCIVAPRRSGKTYLIKEALKYSRNLVCIPSKLGSGYIKNVIQNDLPWDIKTPTPLWLRGVGDIITSIDVTVASGDECPKYVYIEEPSYLDDIFFFDFPSVIKRYPLCVFVFIGTPSLDYTNGFNRFAHKIYKGEIEGKFIRWPSSPFLELDPKLREHMGDLNYKVEFEAKVPVITYI